MIDKSIIDNDNKFQKNPRIHLHKWVDRVEVVGREGRALIAPLTRQVPHVEPLDLSEIGNYVTAPEREKETERERERGSIFVYSVILVPSYSPATPTLHTVTLTYSHPHPPTYQSILIPPSILIEEQTITTAVKSNYSIKINRYEPSYRNPK